MDRLTDSDVQRALSLKIMPAARLLARLEELRERWMQELSGSLPTGDGSKKNPSILDGIWEAVDDYKANRTQRAFTDEERAKAGRAVDYGHPG